MIVQYRKLMEGDKSGSLTIGHLYIVIGILFIRKEIQISILDDVDKYPILSKLEHFKVLDGSLPDSFVLTDYNEGDCIIEPKEFVGDFWDDFHDGGNKEVEEKFRQEIKKLYEFHGWKFNPKHFQYS